MRKTPARKATPDSADVAPALTLAQMIHGGVVTQVVATVARLSLAEQLGYATRSVSELAGATGAHPGALLRLLRAAGPGQWRCLERLIDHWDDEHATHILDRCHRVAAVGSTLLLIERLLPPQPSPLHLSDLVNLGIFGGRERSHDEYAVLLAATGYQLTRLVPISAADPPWSLLEADRQ